METPVNFELRGSKMISYKFELLDDQFKGFVLIECEYRTANRLMGLVGRLFANVQSQVESYQRLKNGT